MLSELKNTLLEYAHSIPLELFTFISTFIEEMLPPIPAPSVITIAGAVAKVQDYSPYFLIILALIGTIGKTSGAIIIYKVVDKLEDVFVSKFGKYFNIEEDKLEAIGKRISGSEKSYLILITLRAIPLFPSTLISVSCGLLKIPFKLFVISTFIGSFIRNLAYVYIGFGSIKIFDSILSTPMNILTIRIFLILALLSAFIYFYRQHTKN